MFTHVLINHSIVTTKWFMLKCIPTPSPIHTRTHPFLYANTHTMYRRFMKLQPMFIALLLVMSSCNGKSKARAMSCHGPRSHSRPNRRANHARLKSKHNATMYPSTLALCCTHDLPNHLHHLHQSRPHQHRFLTQHSFHLISALRPHASPSLLSTATIESY